MIGCPLFLSAKMCVGKLSMDAQLLLVFCPGLIIIWIRIPYPHHSTI